MANIKSQIKRNRQNEKRRLRNRNFRGMARTAVKNARQSLESNTDSQAAVVSAISTLDKAAQKGAIHPRNASRRKGRLMKRLSLLGLELKAPVAESTPEQPAKTEKEARPAKEAKPKAEKKTATKKAAAKKTTSSARKKSAAKK